MKGPCSTSERDDRFRALVQELADDRLRNDAFRSLAGGLTSTELRAAPPLSERAFAALREGLADDNPKVRWLCISILDHVSDPRALDAVAPLLDDPVPRVRRHAAHALGCVVCKPGAEPTLPHSVLAKLAEVARSDPNPKVRREAAMSVACRLKAAEPRE